MTNPYQKALDHWGQEKQLGKAIEELRELRLELWRALRLTPNREAILTETADVLNMIQSLKLIYGITNEELKAEMDRKMQRTMERIDKEVAERNNKG